MARVFVLVIDSLGIGALPDAAAFGDQGSNTLLHIVQHCAAGLADNAQRQGALHIPHLRRAGLSHALRLACGEGLPGPEPRCDGAWAAAREISTGKDTPSGHWEMMGVPVTQPWGLFPPDAEGRCFPPALLERVALATGLPGWLGNCVASGTDILRRLGEAHVRTGRPIAYTSADSVFQVACHEHHFGLDRLHAVCECLRSELDALRIGRVIARPFTGEDAASFRRTPQRRDYTMPPPEATLLERLQEAGGHTVAIGKIADIFAHRGISCPLSAYGTQDLMAATVQQALQAPPQSLVMCNFVDFDQSFGHRRDIAGYAQELELFDRLLPRLQAALQPDDLLLLTADHGCDPSWQGSDHTREHVPQLAWGARVPAGSLGLRHSFADLGQSAAQWLGLPALPHGQGYGLAAPAAAS